MSTDPKHDFSDEEPTKPDESLSSVQLAEFWRLEREMREMRTTQNMRPLKRP